MQKLLIVGVTTCLALLMGLAYTGFAKGSTRCKPGKTCSCVGSKTCSFTCTGKGCKFSLVGSGNRAIFCKAGGCIVDKSGSGDAKIVCQGGGCQVNVVGSGTTLLDCPGKGCKMSCTGTGKCVLVGCKECEQSCVGATCTKQ